MKRCILKLCLFLLLGAIINIAVAWGCAAFSHLTLSAQYPQVLPEFVFQVHPRLDRESQLIQFACVGHGIREDWFVLSPHTSTSPDTSEVWYVLLANRGNGRWIVRVNDLLKSNLAPIRDRSVDALFVTRATAGWPFTSVHGHAYSSFEYDSSRPPGRRNVQTSHSYGRLSLTQSSRTLPLIPAWPGFAINTIVYAAVLWLPFPMFGVVRRRIRAHRGRCTACGYDLRGFRGRESENNLCAECGASASKPS